MIRKKLLLIVRALATVVLAAVLAIGANAFLNWVIPMPPDIVYVDMGEDFEYKTGEIIAAFVVVAAIAAFFILTAHAVVMSVMEFVKRFRAAPDDDVVKKGAST